MKCESCEKEKDDVAPRQDPFAAEVYGEVRTIMVCDDCYEDRAQSI